MDIVKYIKVFAGALAISLLLTPAVRAVALKLGIVDRPDKNLKAHSAPVAYFGGGSDIPFFSWRAVHCKPWKIDRFSRFASWKRDDIRAGADR